MLKPNMPSINDQEDTQVPAELPPIIDAHVHIFPRKLVSAIWKWFDQNGWHIRYQLTSSQVLTFLLSHGIQHIIAFQYAHKPGIANDLNKYMVEKCSDNDNRVTGMATVYPGEKDAVSILKNAFDLGLGGLKLHAHVQCFDMNSNDMRRIYECCSEYKKPIVMHVGREPKSTAYQCDPYKICSAEKLEHVLQEFPYVKICVPHLGIDETQAYQKLIEKYDNLWLDTTMAIAGYLNIKEEINLGRYRHDRVMYGSDFPNIPYAWDRELKILKKANISHDGLTKITHKNATEFFGIKEESIF
jgi:predicted TIM-barrel fold metal-dependent hydrolase